MTGLHWLDKWPGGRGGVTAAAAGGSLPLDKSFHQKEGQRDTFGLECRTKIGGRTDGWEENTNYFGAGMEFFYSARRKDKQSSPYIVVRGKKL